MSDRLAGTVFDGTTARRHDGTTARRHDGSTARRHDGTTARRHDGTTARRHDGGEFDGHPLAATVSDLKEPRVRLAPAAHDPCSTRGSLPAVEEGWVERGLVEQRWAGALWWGLGPRPA
ncbi:MAG: hypothetical protein ABSC41_00005, partial [Acidimicrobiales bacterium]